MARDRETVSREEVNSSGLSRRAAHFAREHPVPSAQSGEVPGLHPPYALVLMAAFGPAPQRLEDRMVHGLEDFGADDMPVIQRPAPDEWVQQADEGPGCCALVGLDGASHFP